MSLPFDVVNREALSRAKTLIPAWLPNGSWQGAEWVALNPKRKDSKAGSLSVNSSTGIWKDFASDDGGADPISLHAWVHGIGQGEACKVLAADFGIKTDAQAEPKDEPAPRYPRPILPVPEGVPALAQRKGEEGRWEYRDAEGRLLLLRVRTSDLLNGKAVITYTWCETGPGMAEWRPKAPGKPWPLYGQDRLARNPEARVLVVEGEKTADAAERIFPGMVAVTSGSVDSAGSAGWEALAGRDVWIWRDADEAGQKYQDKVAELLLGVAKTVRQVALPDAITGWTKPGKDKPGGWDLADPAPAGVDLQAILDAGKQAEPTAPKPGNRMPRVAAWIVGDVGRMLREDPPAVRWLVPGLIPAGMPGILAARSNAGKSMTALMIGMGLASGLGVLGHSVSDEEARGVLFVGLEDDEAEFHRRVRRGIALLEEDPGWTEAHREALALRLVPLFPDRASHESFSLEAQWETLAQKAAAIPGGCGLIILDTLSRMMEGDENSAEHTRPFNEAVSALSQASCAAVMSIHHVGKGNDAPSDKPLWQRLHPEALRGSSAVEAAARFIIQMAALSPGEAQAAGLEPEVALKGGYMAFHLSKMSAAEKGSTILLERRQGSEPGAGFLSLHPESERILALIQGAAATLKLNRKEQVLVMVAEAGGMKGLDQKAAAAAIWTDSQNPKGQWDKALSGLRAAGFLVDLALTDAGWAKAETLGFIPSTRKAARTQKPTGSPETQGLPPGRGEAEETEGNPSFHSITLGNRNGRKEIVALPAVSGDSVTVDL